MITKWRQDHMRNDTVDQDEELSTVGDFDRPSGRIGSVITYITSIEHSNKIDEASVITKAHKFVLLFKFVAALGKMEIQKFSVKGITRYLGMVRANGFKYFAPLLT